MNIAQYAKDAGNAVLKFYKADPVRRIPMTIGVLAGAALGDSPAEKGVYAAGLGTLGYFGKDLTKYAWAHRREIFNYMKRHPAEIGLTLVGGFFGYHAGNFLDVNTQGAFIPLSWADTAGTIAVGVIGNRIGSGIDKKRRRRVRIL